MDRRRMLHTFKTAQDIGNYEDVPVLPAKVDPQLYMSRNTVPQPFHLICGKDTVVVQMAGTAEMYLKDSSVNRFAMTVGDHVYVPAGTPHRIVPSEESVQLRYKARSAGLEGLAWYCPGCDRELHRCEWDTAETISQGVYYDACLAFNNDETLRRCSGCGAQHPRIDMEPFTAWKPLAEQLRAELQTQ
jgi:mannose-6-phosphate isomerase-like protein (cupin superfamily)